MTDDEVNAIVEEVTSDFLTPSEGEPKTSRLEALAIALAALRSEAVRARRESGIEEEWRKAEEAYVGIDNANRGQRQNAKWIKPVSMTGPLVVTNAGGGGEASSTAYVRLTSRYVDAGAAKLGEILLPAGDKAFSFSSTPVPDIAGALEDESQAVVDGQPLERDARPDELQQTPGAAAVPPGSAVPAGALPAAPGSPPGVPIKVKDLAAERVALALKAAKKAETRIYDWMVESRYRAHMRKVVFDAARIGVGVLKGPFPRRVRSSMWDAVTGALKIKYDIRPGYEWKSPWNIFPDPACGEVIGDGDHLFEVDFFSRKQLRRLKTQPGYIPTAIDRVLAEGPMGVDFATGNNDEKVKKGRYAIWYFHGTLKREDYCEAVAMSGGKPEKNLPEDVYAICTMVNDVVVRASLNPLDSGDIPYHAVPWSRREGHWAGIGVGEQLEMPQGAINAATRALFNNAGKSSGSIIVIDDEAIVPADNNYLLLPDKVFNKKPGATMDDVRKAFAFFQVPNMTPQLMSIIDLCLRMAEEVTNIPLVTQGQSGKTTPDTYGGMALQNNNANQLLRNIGYAVDDCITEPVVNQSYEYLLLDPNVPAEEKGDWKIDAHGSVALVERAIQDETIQMMGQFVLNPAFGADPKRWFAEFSKTKRLNPQNFQYTAEEQAERDKIQPPPAPAVQVAQIRSADKDKELQADQAIAAANAEASKAVQQMIEDGRRAVAEMRRQTDELRVKRDTDRDTVYVQAETERTRTESAARMEELRVRERIEVMKYANARQLTLDQVKADLAKTEMTLQVQRELSHATNAAKSGAEPVGKAPNGEAFAK